MFRRAPVPGGGAVYGHSLIVSPWGEVLAEGGDEPGTIVATVDMESVAGVRKRVPEPAPRPPVQTSRRCRNRAGGRWPDHGLDRRSALSEAATSDVKGLIPCSNSTQTNRSG